MCVKVDFKPVVFVQAGFRFGCFAGKGILAAQMSLDPCDQLAGHERLGHIIVSAGRKRDDLIDFLGLAAEKDDRCIGMLPDIQ